MPFEHKSRREVMDAIKCLPSVSDLLSTRDGHFNYELDLEVIVYGRNYGGKKVGPYVRLLTYEPGEVVVREGDWGGNTFYLLVKGDIDVLVETSGGGEQKVAELKPGAQFGEMSVLAGVPRNATVKASRLGPSDILEVQRPALRLLRKLPKFGETLDKTYRLHGRNAAVEDLKRILDLKPELTPELQKISLFKIYSKNHVLFHEGLPVDRVYIVKEGWVRRSRQDGDAETEDFLGSGFCFGLEDVSRNSVWPYTVTMMGRAEIVEVPMGQLRQAAGVRDSLSRELARFAPPPFPLEDLKQAPEVRSAVMSAREDLIDTGLVDATNLLVMDMDLCVRCGNCSLACHKIHGQSRLTRRGIHVTRLKAPKASAHQSILSPEVCMHCKDPECLTGCPTGAIGRFTGGQIDINASTCIGCGDCAAQCPYDAISMTSRRPPAPARMGLAARVKDVLRIRLDPLPPPAEATDDLLAVKCNLCSDRASLNPPGAKRRAYSCEENCPTGALARINPREYFTEIGEIEGLLVLDPRHAIGRNIHRSDPPRRLTHAAGILGLLLVTAVAVFGLDRYGFGERVWGFLNMRWMTGLAGLAAIFFAMLYPVRRQIYKKRAGALRYWMLAHSYLGVLGAAMIFLHGGTDSGGALTTALMISFDLVILTGLFGIACYYLGPRLLTKIEGAPLLLDDLLARRQELQKELLELAWDPSEQVSGLVRSRVIPRFISFGYLLRQYTKREALDRALDSAKVEFKAEAEGLEKERDRRRLMRAVESAAAMRRVDALIYVHRLLKAWLPPHVATTSLMLALMIVHVIQVIYYAAG
ncbi:MAG TPA: cyclic nucleotide-binding domain-containing protein [Blastocatellia bacterium]|nr:cyclic nucleotide-binding domain-containing protein [Blastocatellia bacterium]